MASVELRNLTAIIKTFQRPRSLDRLIRSIRSRYGDLRVVVADDSPEPVSRDDVDVIALPGDVGLSAGRNALLARVRTPYFLLLDDDLELTAKTRIERLLQLAASDQLDVAAGTYLRCKRKFGLFVKKRPQPYHGLLQVDGSALRLVEGGTPHQAGYLSCDLVHNFFVGVTAKVRALGGWDEDLRLDEHEEFFFRAKRFGLRVGVCPDVVARHWNARSKNYDAFRFRNHKPLAVAKMGMERMIDFAGNVHEAAPLESASLERAA